MVEQSVYKKSQSTARHATGENITYVTDRILSYEPVYDKYKKLPFLILGYRSHTDLAPLESTFA